MSNALENWRSIGALVGLMPIISRAIIDNISYREARQYTRISVFSGAYLSAKY